MSYREYWFLGHEWGDLPMIFSSNEVTIECPYLILPLGNIVDGTVPSKWQWKGQTTFMEFGITTYFAQPTKIYLRSKTINRDSFHSLFLVIEIWWKIRMVAIRPLTIKSLQNFMHSAAARLSCHVQNFIGTVRMWMRTKGYVHRI